MLCLHERQQRDIYSLADIMALCSSLAKLNVRDKIFFPEEV